MIDVLIITFNESANLSFCLKALDGWTRKIFVVDSGSTDKTCQIATEHGAVVVHHDWPGYAAQRNWALENLPLEADWILILDADEIITEALRDQIVRVIDSPTDSINENGFFINRLSYFLDRPIHHCGYFPSWNLRLFKRGKGKYENRAVHEHIIIDDPVGYIREPMLHRDRRGLEHFYAKHNRYSTLEAGELFREITQPKPSSEQANLTTDTRRRRWLKRNLARRLPFPAVWRFLYMFVLRVGFLDGWAGYRFSLFIANYDAMVAFKLKSIFDSIRRDDGSAEHALGNSLPALAQHEGDLESPTPQSTPSQQTSPASSPTPLQMRPESSPWSLGGKIARALWMLIGKPLFRCSFHNWYRYRNLILRLFGAKVGRGVTIRPTVKIEIPWQLDIQDGATIGDYAILYSLGKITVGPRAIISQYAHLCAGSHDYTDHTFRLQRLPVTIGADVWIGADSYIGPDVIIGNLTVIGARASVYKDMPPAKVCVGNPAKPIRDRVLT